MNLTKLINALKELAETAQKAGVDPMNVKVFIRDYNQEALDEASDVDLHLDIDEEDIPYDISGIDPIKEHDNVVIIGG